MANDTETKQNHRKSFFLFGNVGGHKAEPMEKTTTVNSSRPKNDKTRRPLDIQPFKNKNPFIQGIDHTDVQEVPKTASSLKKSTGASMTGPGVAPVRRGNTNPFLTDTNVIAVKKVEPRMRRPPPPIDMEAVKVYANTPPLEITSSISTAQTSSADETLKSASLSPMRTPVPQVKTLTNQHRRQRSEAEKLVDDLDDYIKQHEARSKLQDSDKEGSEAIPTKIDSDSSLESAFMSVDPLSMVASDRESRFVERIAGRKSDIGSEFDTDAFSFTDSLNGKSVNSIQQVAMTENNGAAPILMKLRYTNSNVTQSDSNDYYDAAAHSFQAQRDSSGAEQATRLVGSRKVEQDERTGSDDVSGESQVDSDEPRRTFRVVNEDRPHFYFQTAGDTTASTNTSTTTDDDAAESSNGRLIEAEYVESAERPSATNGSNRSYNQHSSSVDEQFTEKRPSSPRKCSEEVDTMTSEDFNRVGSLLEGGALQIQEPGDAAPKLETSTVFSNPSIKSGGSTATTTSSSSAPDKTVRLVSSYVEELRLKYYKTSNFLAAPPNLPITLKQKNNLIQPKNIKVRIRTSSKQIGIKHGGAKQKLLSLETSNEEPREGFGAARFQSIKNRIDVDHTKEFHDLLSNGGMPKPSSRTRDRQASQSSDDDPEKFLNDIPGDDAYDSDDAMAPLREKGGARSLKGPTRSNTVVSYYTKNQGRLRSGTLDNGYQHLQNLPTNINIKDYEDKESVATSGLDDSATSDEASSLEQTFSYSKGQGLHVANPDVDSD